MGDDTHLLQTASEINPRQIYWQIHSKITPRVQTVCEESSTSSPPNEMQYELRGTASVLNQPTERESLKCSHWDGAHWSSGTCRSSRAAFASKLATERATRRSGEVKNISSCSSLIPPFPIYSFQKCVCTLNLGKTLLQLKTPRHESLNISQVELLNGGFCFVFPNTQNLFRIWVRRELQSLINIFKERHSPRLKPKSSLQEEHWLREKSALWGSFFPLKNALLFCSHFQLQNACQQIPRPGCFLIKTSTFFFKCDILKSSSPPCLCAQPMMLKWRPPPPALFEEFSYPYSLSGLPPSPPSLSPSQRWIVESVVEFRGHKSCYEFLMRNVTAPERGNVLKTWLEAGGSRATGREKQEVEVVRLGGLPGCRAKVKYLFYRAKQWRNRQKRLDGGRHFLNSWTQTRCAHRFWENVDRILVI